MGRSVPSENLSLIHPFLYLSFLAVGIAASMAIITTICSFRFRRKSSPPPPPPSDHTDIAKDKELDEPTPPSTTEPHIEKTETETENVDIKELPLPPALQQPKDALPSNINMKRVTSERRASFSLSIKMPRSLSVARTWDHLKDEKIKGNLGKLTTKTEDSVWMKTIILGEKCVPDEEDDPVIFEGKGKKIQAYHPKSNSISISRQCSFLEPDALPSSQPQTHDKKINDT